MLNRSIAKVSKQESAFNRIMQFITEGDITLTADEETIFQRWNYAHKLYLQRKYTSDQIADKIKDAFQVSFYTGRNDVYHAQALFGGSIKANKKFLLHHHAENLMLLIEKWKLDKSLAHLVPKLADAYTKAIVAIPDELNKDIMPPAQIFIIEKDATIPANFEEAIRRIKLIDKPVTEDIEFKIVDESNP